MIPISTKPFQYGRYLLAGSSRPGDLPANLQGIWNNGNSPAWASDYHSNINIQMNYWLAEPSNLSDCHTPLIDWLAASLEPNRKATRASFGENPRLDRPHLPEHYGGNGWQAEHPLQRLVRQHIWEHFASTQTASGSRPATPCSRRSASSGRTTSRSCPTASSSPPTAGRPSTARARTASPTTSRSSGTSSRTLRGRRRPRLRQGIPRPPARSPGSVSTAPASASGVSPGKRD
ncbi:MAG: hypothetical protein U1F87_06705 [Kiritimatiellia bacterium]